jgi:hypothetical protein
MSFSLKQLEDKVKPLVAPNFKYKKGIGGFSFKEIHAEKKLNLYISYTGYPDMYRLSPAVVNLEFLSVENILREALSNCNLNSSVAGNTIGKVCLNITEVDYQIFNKIMHNESDFEEVGIELQKTIELGAYPFFEKYDSLEKVLEFTEKMELKDIMNVIAQPLPFRRLIIKGLCKHNTYLEYYENLLNIYFKEGNPSDIVLINKIKEIVDLEISRI